MSAGHFCDDETSVHHNVTSDNSGNRLTGELWDQKYYSEAALEQQAEKYQGDQRRRYLCYLVARQKCKMLKVKKRHVHEVIESHPGKLRNAALEYQLQDVWRNRHNLVRELREEHRQRVQVENENANLRQQLGHVDQLVEQHGLQSRPGRQDGMAGLMVDLDAAKDRDAARLALLQETLARRLV